MSSPTVASQFRFAPQIRVAKDTIIANKYLIIVWGAFWLFLMFSMSNVFMYYDDFGYASLTYVYELPGVTGHEFTLAQLIAFLREIYFRWSGRVVFPGLKILMLSNSIWLMRIVQSISVLATFYLLYRISSKNASNKLLTAIFTISLYGVFSFEMFRAGFYWFSASATFILPIPLLLLSVLLLQKILSSSVRSYAVTVLCCVCLFLVSLSVEQLAVTTVVFIGTLVFNDYHKSKWVRRELLYCFGSSLLGAAFMMLAPGNFGRFTIHGGEGETSLLNRLGNNLVVMAQQALDITGNGLFLVLYVVLVSYLAVSIWERSGRTRAIILTAIPLSAILLVSAAALIEHPSSSSVNIVTAIFYLYSAVAILIIYLYLSYQTDSVLLIGMFVGAVMSQLLFLPIASYLSERMMIIFYVAVFSVFIRTFSDICSRVPLRVLATAILAPVLAGSSIFLGALTWGYWQNAPTHRLNDQTLRLASAELQDGNNVSLIALDAPRSWRYAADFKAFTLYWMRDFYNIPGNVPIIYPLDPSGFAVSGPISLADPNLAEQLSVEFEGNSYWWWLDRTQVEFAVNSTFEAQSVSFTLAAAECSAQRILLELESGGVTSETILDLAASESYFASLDIPIPARLATLRISSLYGLPCTTPGDGRARVALFANPLVS